MFHACSSLLARDAVVIHQLGGKAVRKGSSEPVRAPPPRCRRNEAGMPSGNLHCLPSAGGDARQLRSCGEGKGIIVVSPQLSGLASHDCMAWF